MAKKKSTNIDDIKDIKLEDIEEESVEKRESSPEEIRLRISKEIEKSLGKGVIVNGTEIIERPKTIISVSPAIDHVLNGGIPEGSWVILSGKEKCGKTVTSLHFAKNCHKDKYGNRNVYYLNVEGRLKKRDILGIPGINPDKLVVIESTEDKILSSQEYLQTAEKILLTDKKCVLIIDSISQLCDEREMTGGVGTQTRGSGAIWVSQFTSQMSNVVPVKNSIVICILHLRSNTSGYGETWLEKGGKAIQYQADIKLRAEGSPEPWVLVKAGEPIGQIVTWKCHSSALGPPGRKCESYIRYGHGIDEVVEILADAKDVGLIGVGGAWMYFNFLKNHMEEMGLGDREWNEDLIKEIEARGNGLDKTRKVLLDNPQWFDWLKEDLKAIL